VLSAFDDKGSIECLKDESVYITITHIGVKLTNEAGEVVVLEESG
jgi:hypothetical protein